MAKKKYNYTKKTGRPQMTMEKAQFPENWKDILFTMSAKGCSTAEIKAEFLTSGSMDCKCIRARWDRLKVIDAEFTTAIQIGHILCQAWWEKQSRTSLKSKNFQTGSWYANMKNRFGWRDRTEIGHDIAEGLYDQFADLTGKDLKALARSIVQEIAGSPGGDQVSPEG